MYRERILFWGDGMRNDNNCISNEKQSVWYPTTPLHFVVFIDYFCAQVCLQILLLHHWIVLGFDKSHFQ